MSASKKHVATEIRRLMGKPFPPADEIAVDELVEALARECESAAHVTRVVDQILRVPGPFPEVAEFVRVAEATRTMSSQPDRGCGRCGGSGYVPREVGGKPVTRPCWCGTVSTCLVCGGSGHYVAVRGAQTFSGRCDCWALRPKPDAAVLA